MLHNLLDIDPEMDKTHTDYKGPFITMRTILLPGAAAFIYSAFIVVFTDYLAYDRIGSIISTASVLIIILLALIRYRIGLLSALFIIFTFPTFPRDILDVYSALQETKTVAFYSVKFMSFAGFTLAQWMFVALFVIASARFLLSGGRISSGSMSGHVKLLFLFVLLLLLAAMLSSFTGSVINMKELVSDLRFPILFLFGTFVAWSYVQDCGGSIPAIHNLVVLLLLLLVVSGFKTVLFLTDDRMRGVFRLGLANPIYVVFPFLIALILTKKHLMFSRPAYIMMNILGSLAIIPEGRGTFIVYALVLSMAFLVAWGRKDGSAAALSAQLVSLSIVSVVVLITVIGMHERLWQFILYKASFFTGEMVTGALSESPLVRVYEFMNILSEHVDTGIGLIWGKGAGGYFHYKAYPLPFELGASDYSVMERTTGMFYHPHLPFNFWLLKGGILGLLLYGTVFYRIYAQGREMLRRGHESAWPGRLTFAYYLVLSSMVGFLESFWQPDYTFLYAVILGVAYLDEPGWREQHNVR